MSISFIQQAGVDALQRLHFQQSYEKERFMKEILEGENLRHRRLDRAIAFLSSLARILLLSGGNRSGKTFLGTLEMLWRAIGKHPYKEVPRPPVFLRQFTEMIEKYF